MKQTGENKMPRGFRLISQGERYENDTRISAFDERNRIELGYIETYNLGCATPCDSIAKDVEIKNDLTVKLEIPKTDFRNPNVQNILEWANLPVSDDDYYRDLAVSLQMAGNNHRTVLLSHARISQLVIDDMPLSDFITMTIHAQQKESQFHGVIIGGDVASTYERARAIVPNPPMIGMVAFGIGMASAMQSPVVETRNSPYWVRLQNLAHSEIIIQNDNAFLRTEPGVRSGTPIGAIVSNSIIPRNTRLTVIEAARYMDSTRFVAESGGTMWYRVRHVNRSGNEVIGWIPERLNNRNMLSVVSTNRRVIMVQNPTSASGGNSVAQVWGHGRPNNTNKAGEGGPMTQATFAAVNSAVNGGGVVHRGSMSGLENGTIVTLTTPENREPVREPGDPSSVPHVIWIQIDRWERGSIIAATGITNVERLSWDEVRRLDIVRSWANEGHRAPNRDMTLIDVRTGRRFSMIYYAHSNMHIDVVTPDRGECSIINEIRSNVTCWCARPIWVTIGDRTIAASIITIPI